MGTAFELGATVTDFYGCRFDGRSAGAYFVFLVWVFISTMETKRKATGQAKKSTINPTAPGLLLYFLRS